MATPTGAASTSPAALIPADSTGPAFVEFEHMDELKLFDAPRIGLNALGNPIMCGMGQTDLVSIQHKWKPGAATKPAHNDVGCCLWCGNHIFAHPKVAGVVPSGGVETGPREGKPLMVHSVGVDGKKWEDRSDVKWAIPSTKLQEQLNKVACRAASTMRDEDLLVPALQERDDL